MSIFFYGAWIDWLAGWVARGAVVVEFYDVSVNVLTYGAGYWGHVIEYCESEHLADGVGF